MKYIILLFCIASYSQQVILSAGKDEYSIGQVFYQYDNGGIQIPEELPPTLYLPSFVYQIENTVTVNVANYRYINFKLFDLTGRVIKKGIVVGKESIYIEDLPRGIYLLNLENQTFKIIKL